MRKQSVVVKKLTIKKFEVSKLNNSQTIFGGGGARSFGKVSDPKGGSPGPCGQPSAPGNGGQPRG